MGPLTCVLSPKELLHTTRRQDALLSEQSQLQRDISEWMRRFKNCQKEEEAKQQQLQVLQDEIEKNQLKLAQQETVALPPRGFEGRAAFVTHLCAPG